MDVKVWEVEFKFKLATVAATMVFEELSSRCEISWICLGVHGDYGRLFVLWTKDSIHFVTLACSHKVSCAYSFLFIFISDTYLLVYVLREVLQASA